jgi:acetyl-CoA carboxylase biotin carboxyl carrier protein
MKAKEIRDLIDFISESGLEEVNIETEEFKIRVKRNPESTIAHIAPAAPMQVQPVASAPVLQPTNTPTASDGSSADANLLTIKSPMIGTFYRSANPESEIFVKVGDNVKSGTPVCIIEAMKLFNEIESEISGKIVKVLVEDAQPVEFDQPLFLVDPS